MKKRKQPAELRADQVFAEASTNAFLVALESWIARKLPTAPAVPEAQVEQAMAELERLTKLAEKPDADGELILRQMVQAVTPIFPAAPPDSPPELVLNRHERLFRAVFFFGGESYNDGVESYLTVHDATDVLSAIEGLAEIGASEMQARLASLCEGLFGERYPETEEARGAVVESPSREQAALLDEFGRFFARHSAELDQVLAAWARANRAYFEGESGPP